MREATQEELVLRANLPELARLQPWLERVAKLYQIPEDVLFSSNVCLEEVLSNIVLHGRKRNAAGRIKVVFKIAARNFLFTVEDDAPHFNPLVQPELPPLQPGEEMRIGGHGIRFLRELASDLEYEPLPDGNRLKISFHKT